jgi:hypothetical protein
VITLDARVRPHDDVVDTELEAQETVLLHLNTKLYFSLNSTGTRIWKGLKRQQALGTISRQLQDEFDVDAEQAAASVLSLVTELEREGLVVRMTAAD